MRSKTLSSAATLTLGAGGHGHRRWPSAGPGARDAAGPDRPRGPNAADVLSAQLHRLGDSSPGCESARRLHAHLQRHESLRAGTSAARTITAARQTSSCMHGMIVATQNPLGGGGILLTDKAYKNFELYMEVKPDFGNDSGIFLRSTESGAAYQVTMDFLPNGGMGNVIGEGGMQLAARGRGAARRPRGRRSGGAAGAAGRRRRSRGWRCAGRRRGPRRTGRSASGLRRRQSGHGRLGQGVETRRLERGSRPHDGRNAARHRLVQRRADHRLPGHGQQRHRRHHRRSDRHSGPRRRRWVPGDSGGGGTSGIESCRRGTKDTLVQGGAKHRRRGAARTLVQGGMRASSSRVGATPSSTAGLREICGSF